MADVVKGLTHLAVNQAFVSSSLIIRPIQAKLNQFVGSFFIFYSIIVIKLALAFGGLNL